MIDAVRSFRRQQKPILIAGLIIVVAITVATTMFGLSDPYVLRPLPYSEPDRLVTIDVDVGMATRQEIVPSLADWQSRTDLFDGVAAIGRGEYVRIQLADRMLPLQSVAVSTNLLSVLGVAVRGPGLPPQTNSVWISEDAAEQSLGELASGRVARILPSGSLDIAGVLPGSFLFPDPNRTTRVDLLLPLPPGRIATIDRVQTRMSIETQRLIGRLRPHITPTIAADALNAGFPPGTMRVQVLPLADAMTTRLRRLAFGAIVASLLVLAVCYINIVGVSLTRGIYRARDLMTRGMLGATHANIARLLVGESAILAGATTAISVAAATALMTWVSSQMPIELMTLGRATMTSRAVLFGCIAGAGAFAAWCLGSMAAWRLYAPEGGANVHLDNPALRILRGGLVAGQVGIAVVLLSGAALLGRSYVNLLRVDSGVDGRSFALSVLYPAEASHEHLRTTLNEALQAIRRVPGVRSAAASGGGLLDGLRGAAVVIVNGRPVPVDFTEVTPDYFRATGMGLVAGRPFNERDRPTEVAILNETLANRLFPGTVPTGRQAAIFGDQRQIVGIVRDSRRQGLTQKALPSVFTPMAQASSRVTYVVGTSGSAADIAVDWARIVQSVDLTSIVLDGSSLKERLARTVRDRHFATLVAGLFAFATVLVSLVGLTGVVSHTVARRTREIGIRIALGASQRSIRWLVMRDAVLAATAGASVGLLVAYWSSQLIDNLLYGVPPRDVFTMALSTVGLVALAALCASLTTRRAADVAPSVAIRSE